jgi:hypothetical protein
MISFWRNRLFHQTWHPSFEELMLYLDGELGAKKDRVGSHAKNCWSCRLRLEKIERAISEFMEARHASFGGPPEFPGRALPRFAAKLDRLEADCGVYSLFSAVIRQYAHGLFARRAPARVTLLLASLGLTATIFWLNITQPVSAKEVLFRVREAEARQMGQVLEPVIYEKLELLRSSQRHHETVSWEIWNDTKNKRLRQRVNAAPTPVARVLEDYEEVFRSHRADLGRPLSPSNYELWRDSITQESEEVFEGRLPNGDRATILKVSGRGPFPPDAIVDAEFTVRAADWHPVGQRLRVQKEHEVVDYSLGEVAFDVMALNTVPSSIFADPAPAPMRISRAPLPRLMPVPVHVELWPAEADLLPTEADLTAAEVEARYALHSVRACMGRPIAVRVGLGRIEVEGVVDSDERKAEVLLALRGIPLVAAGIRSVAEVPGNPVGEGVPAALDQQADAGAPKPKLVIEDWLKKYFSAGKCAGLQSDGQSACVQEEIAGLSREALARSEAAQAQAWALRRLVEWEPFLKRDELRTSTRRLLELMVREHMDALRNELKQSHAQLRPILSALLGADTFGTEKQLLPAPDQQGGSLSASLLRLCTSVEKAMNLTLGTFAETNRPVDQPEQAMKELLSKLDGLNREFPDLEAYVDAELSGFGNTGVSSERQQRK